MPRRYVLCVLGVQQAPDIVRRWVNEIQTVMTTKSDMVQYHALALMRTIKAADKLAISKARVCASCCLALPSRILRSHRAPLLLTLLLSLLLLPLLRAISSNKIACIPHTLAHPPPFPRNSWCPR